MHRIFSRTILKRSLLVLCFFMATSALAQTATPTPAPACSLADINQALANDLTCNTTGLVIFGSDVTQFILNQCSPVTNPGESAPALKQAQLACINCARKAWEAFGAAKHAGLIPSAGSVKPNTAKIKSLCAISDNGGDGSDGHKQPQESDALKAMFDQIRLCFPQDGGQPVAPADCLQCGVSALDGALSSGVINQTKYDVIKKSIGQVCAHQGGTGEHPNPSASPTPGSGSFDQWLSGMRSCFGQFHSPGHMNPDACVSCLNAIPSDGLDATRLSAYLGEASKYCLGTFTPHEPSPSPSPTVTPTPSGH
jgi:hypothetical protein